MNTIKQSRHNEWEQDKNFGFRLQSSNSQKQILQVTKSSLSLAPTADAISNYRQELVNYSSCNPSFVITAFER